MITFGLIIIMAFLMTVFLVQTSYSQYVETCEDPKHQKAITPIDLDYKIDGGTVTHICKVEKANSVIILVDAKSDGQLTITIPKNIIYSLSSTDCAKDSDLMILMDNEEVLPTKSIHSKKDNTITVEFSKGINTIEFIGFSIMPDPSPSQYCGIVMGFDSLYLPPKFQIERGMKAEQIRCNEGLEIVIKLSDNKPACVKPETKQKLIQRGLTVNPEENIFPDSAKSATLPKFEITGLNYANHPDEPLRILVEKIGYSMCDSWDARIIDISDNSVVWERDSFNSCVVLDPPKQQKFEYKISNEYRPIIVSKVGDYVFQITIGDMYLEKEFIVRNNSTGASLERTAYPTIIISSTKHDPSPNSIILQIGVNNTTYWKNESEMQVTLISEDGRWSSGLIPPNDGKIIQFNQTAFYKYDGHPQTAINGRIAILSDQTQFLPIQEKLAIAREIIKVDMGPPITAIGIGNADNVLDITIHENELKKNPNAEEYYKKRYQGMIPFEVPIRIEFGHIEPQ